MNVDWSQERPRPIAVSMHDEAVEMALEIAHKKWLESGYGISYTVVPNAIVVDPETEAKTPTPSDCAIIITIDALGNATVLDCLIRRKGTLTVEAP